MGHARAYMAFDIVRRVLSNYFNYDVLYVMNVTDIDDKIIKRARQNNLYEQYVAKDHPLRQVLQDVMTALKWYEQRHNAEPDVDKKKTMFDTVSFILFINALLILTVKPLF